MKHLYAKYENAKIWKIIERALEDLSKNNDIEISTCKEYVIGFICQQLESENCIISGE